MDATGSLLSKCKAWVACVAGVRSGRGDSGKVTSAWRSKGYTNFPASLAPEFPLSLPFQTPATVLGYLLCRITEVSIRSFIECCLI